MIDTPIFYVAAERSGTTMFRLMLDHHPMIAMHHEFEYAVDLITDNEHWPPLDTYYEYLQLSRTFKAAHVVIDPSLSYPELVDSFLVQVRDRAGKQLVGAKVFRRFDRLPRIWPHAKYIHLIRDGRDVARSVTTMGWAGNVWVGTDVWIEAERTWDRLRPRLSPDQWLDLRYEDLVTAPERSLRAVCRFIDVPYHPAMLDYHRDTTYDPPDAKLAHQWIDRLTPREIRLVESRIADRLLHRDYQLSGLPPARVPSWLDRSLRIQSRLRTIRFGLKRYGLPLWAAGVISRRFGPRSLRDKITLRMNEIRNRHLK